MANGTLFRIGLISDTHGRFRNGLIPFLNGCDEVLHAGDVTSDDLLREMSAFAAVRAVRGNNDFMMDTPMVLIRRYGHLTAAVVHDLGTPAHPCPAAAAAIRDASPDLIVHGHTHIPSAEIFDGRVYANPGSAGGLGRSGAACSAARIDVSGSVWSLRFFEIDEGGPAAFGDVLSFPCRPDSGG